MKKILTFTALLAAALFADDADILDYVDAKLASIPEPDFSTSNETLVATIQATAPAPGDYAIVSSKAMHAVTTNTLGKATIKGLTVQTYDGIRVHWFPGDNYWLDIGADVGRYSERGMWGFLFGSGDDNVRVWWALPNCGGELATTDDIAAAAAAATNETMNIVTTAVSGKQDNLPYPTNAIPYAAIIGKPTIPTVPTNVSAFTNDAGYLTSYTETDPTVPSWAKASNKPTYTASEVGAATPEDVTAAIREQSLGGIWDQELQVWWTPVMSNGSLTYQATTNVNLNAEN